MKKLKCQKKGGGTKSLSFKKKPENLYFQMIVFIKAKSRPRIASFNSNLVR